MIDGVLEPSTERLYGIRNALQTCGALLDDLKKNYPARRETDQRVDTFNICDLIQAQVRLVAAVANSKNVRLSYGHSAHGSECAHQGDPDQVGHIVRNTLLSAVRYTPPGGTIAIDYLAPEGEIQLSVQHSQDGLDFPHASKLLEALGANARQTGESHAGNTFVLKLPALMSA
jgi:signal transduction histidine kinase